MAETATKTRVQEYWTIDFEAEGFRPKRFVEPDVVKAAGIVNTIARVFAGEPHQVRVNHVRSFK